MRRGGAAGINTSSYPQQLHDMRSRGRYTFIMAEQIKKERNARIVYARDNRGESFGDISRRYKLSKSTVYNIYWQEKLRRGEHRNAPQRVCERFAHLIRDAK